MTPARSRHRSTRGTAFATGAALACLAAACSRDAPPAADAAPAPSATTPSSDAPSGPALSTTDFVAAARAALGGDVTTIVYAGAGWEACLGQAWSVDEGWARWELTDYRRTTDYAAGRSSHETLRRGAMDPGRAGGCGAQPGAAAAPQTGTITSASGWPDQLPIWLAPHGLLALADSGGASVERDGAGWQVTVPVARDGIDYTLIGRSNERYELESVQTWIDDSVFGDMEVVARFGPYRDFGELSFPERLTIEQGGFATFDLTVESAAPSAEPPAAATPGRPRGGAAGAQEPYVPIADGVFVMLGAYQSVAVELDEFAVVIDGLQSDARTQEIIRLTHEAIPGKPIRYVVTTHSHFDHASGLRQFAAEGSVILTHAMNVEFFAQALAAPRTLDTGNWEPDVVTPQLQGIDDRFTISDNSGQRVDVIALGPSSHAADQLIAYLPNIGTVVEADILQPWINPVFGGGRDGPHPYLSYLYDELERLGLDYEQFVPIHVPPEPPTMPRSALLEAVGRLPRTALIEAPTP